MLDIRLIRETPDVIRQALRRKGVDANIDGLLALDAQRRELVTKVEALKSERNTMSAQVGQLMKSGGDASAIKNRVREIADEIVALDAAVVELENNQRDVLLGIPNVPDASVPDGTSEEDNRVAGEWGTAADFAFTPKPHWELGPALGILDFERGANLSGSGFIAYKGAGARLQRALIHYMLNVHTQAHGYTEVDVPYIVQRAALIGTGQLPKFEDQLYRIESDDLFLVPTAEVPVTNLHAGEILDGATLPICYAAYTPCFRREAGAAGRENRGITRVHQFDKVELVRTVRPEDSMAELEVLRGHAERILQDLGLHYRVLEICSGDLGFSNTKQYDLEVWAPGMGRFLEVSSISNFTDYQARRANIRFRRDAKAKPEFAHTLNGSGLALPRTVIAILETYQQADGSVRVPEVLQALMGTDTIRA